ncbi:MAG: hypothetical protein FWF25_00445 [Propionibacteriaceae bacterium]|nr:hypothetical protein [Propionibacteriaceae bacterium]
MSEPRRAITDRPRKTRRRAAILVVLLSVAVLVSSALVYALWQAIAPVDEEITAGNFGLDLGTLTWSVPEQNRHGQFTIDLPDLLLAPGQTLELHQEVKGSFDGANLAVAFSVNFPDFPDAEGTWYLASPDGSTVVAPASGVPVPLDHRLVLPHDLLTGTQTWIVVVAVKPIASDSTFPWVDPTNTTAFQGGTVDMGALTVKANQVRCGVGFTTACPEDFVEGPDE